MFFDQSEYDNRLTDCRQTMERKGIDVLIDSDPANMNYVTGYDGWSFYIPQAVVIFVDRDQPIWFGRGVDISGARLTTRLSENNIVVYTDDYVHNTTKHPMDVLGELLISYGCGSKTIGLEHDCNYFTPLCRDALQASMPNAEFVDAGKLVNWQRLIKSDAEIEAISSAARITEKIVQTFFDVVEPGVRQCDAVAALYAAQTSGVEGVSGEFCAAIPMLLCGRGTSAPHLPWSGEALKSGEAIILETSGVSHRYHCPMARTVHLGPPPEVLSNASRGVIEGNAAALEVAKAGNTCEDVEAAWREVIGKYGLVKESRIGYPIGIGYPPDWGEHTASLRQGDRTELVPNMVFHLMTGIWMDDWGIEISETFRVTDQGGVPFASVPNALHVKN